LTGDGALSLPPDLAHASHPIGVTFRSSTGLYKRWAAKAGYRVVCPQMATSLSPALWVRSLVLQPGEYQAIPAAEHGELTYKEEPAPALGVRSDNENECGTVGARF
jgi:hypothetical protein